MLHDDDEDFFFNELNSLIGDPASPTNNQSSFFGDDVIKVETLAVSLCLSPASCIALRR